MGQAVCLADREPIDLAPPYAYQDPFLNAAWADSRVRVTKGDRELAIDVRD